MATIETRKRQIESAFKNYQSIFDPSAKIEIKGGVGEKTNIIFVPNIVDHDNPCGGLPLKEGVGYLSIKEDLDDQGKVLGYLYRFTSDEYTYIADKKQANSDWDGFFNFHYQKDANREDDKHRDPHISFLHSSIGYISRAISLEEFLSFVERTFFINGARKNSLPWHSHF